MALLRWPRILAGISFTSAVHAATHQMDFDVPRNGPQCVRAYVGDRVHFHWDEYHNLKKLNSESAYSSCSFSGAVNLQASGMPNTNGMTQGPFNSARDYFYSCSKICSSHGHKVRVCVADPNSGLADWDIVCPCSEGVYYGGIPSFPNGYNPRGGGVTSGTSSDSTDSQQTTSSTTIRSSNSTSPSFSTTSSQSSSPQTGSYSNNGYTYVTSNSNMGTGPGTGTTSGTVFSGATSSSSTGTGSSDTVSSSNSGTTSTYSSGGTFATMSYAAGDSSTVTGTTSSESSTRSSYPLQENSTYQNPRYSGGVTQTNIPTPSASSATSVMKGAQFFMPALLGWSLWALL